MKKIFSSVLTSLGFGASSPADAANTTVDVDAIRYSMPTVAGDEIAFIMPTRESFEGAPQFHEDESRQIEFISTSQLPETKARLREFKAFEERHRTKFGWTDILARRV